MTARDRLREIVKRHNCVTCPVSRDQDMTDDEVIKEILAIMPELVEIDREKVGKILCPGDGNCVKCFDYDVINECDARNDASTLASAGVVKIKD